MVLRPDTLPQVVRNCGVKRCVVGGKYYYMGVKVLSQVIWPRPVVHRDETLVLVPRVSCKQEVNAPDVTALWGSQGSAR
jgi:hypothetical protein